jgi:YggT family protein
VIQQAIAFVVDTLFTLFILAALVRFWMQVFRAPSYNPLAQFTMSLTNWAVKPLRRVIPGAFKLDLASLVVAWVLELVLQLILLALKGVNPFESMTVFSVVLFLSFVKLIRLSIYVFIGAIFIQAILSFVSPRHPVAPFFDALSRPFLKPFQRAIPPLGGVDLSPLLALIALQLILMLPVTWLEQESLRMVSRAIL